MCREAVGWGWREDNPARGIKRRKESTRGAGNPFTREELDRVLRAAADDENRYFRALPVFLAESGCRLGEALKLQWSDVDLGAGTVTFRDTKNGRDHVMPLTQRTVEALREVGSIRVLGDDRVFRLVNHYKMWKRCLKRAGVPYRRIHDLRHSFASASD